MELVSWLSLLRQHSRKQILLQACQSPRGLIVMSSAPAVPSLHQSRVNPILAMLEWFGELGMFVWTVIRAAVTPPFQFAEFFRQLDEVGAKSLPLVALAGSAIGVVLALETRYSLVRFGAKSLLPTTIVFAIAVSYTH